MTIRTLILSGGGGRGAFHAGVYKYLCEVNKPGVDASHQGAWIPDVIVGTSIGALNGAAITQGISAADLESFWLSLREHDIQGLPPGMGPVARYFSNAVWRRSLGRALPQVRGMAMSPTASDSWPPIPILPRWLGERLIGRWSNLLDTAPLYHTIEERLGLREEKLAASATTLLIYATNVRTGEGVTFCNRPRDEMDRWRMRGDVRPGITARRIVASCSIPLVYPWTKDTDGELYWDGAIVANTPLGAAFDAVRGRPMSEAMEVVVVLLNPWWESGENPPPRDQHLPGDFGEAMTWTLDWAMLASFRVSLKMLRAFNIVVNEQTSMGQPPTFRRADDLIVAPERFLPVARILDYDEDASRELIALGYAAAEKAFQTRFGE